MSGGSAKAVYAAIGANSFLTVVKFVGFSVSGSASMLSEAIHSASDAANQTLLAVGIHRSKRPPSVTHPFGYGRELYVWSLVSAVGIFFLGCGLSVYHGVLGVLHPHQIEASTIALGILGLSAVVEGATLMVAIREVGRAADAAGTSFWRYVKEGSDPMAVAVLLEDGAAELGVIVAAACLGMAAWTGDPRWDAAGSIFIGLLLGFVAIFLIRRSGDILVGRSADDETVAKVRAVLLASPLVESTTQETVTIVGADNLHYRVEIDFDGRVVAQGFIDSLPESERDDLVAVFGSREGLDAFFERYGDEMMDHLGRVVDGLEAEIQEAVPAVKHLDLEVHADD
jgi:zinc transporter 9